MPLIIPIQGEPQVQEAPVLYRFIARFALDVGLDAGRRALLGLEVANDARGTARCALDAGSAESSSIRAAVDIQGQAAVPVRTSVEVGSEMEAGPVRSSVDVSTGSGLMVFIDLISELLDEAR
jgi:hypothetical protein